VSDLFDLPFDDEAEEDSVLPEPRTPRHVYTVSELTRLVRGDLERRYADLWLEGEISNCRRWNTGHLYFTLKDEHAQVRAVMFRTSLRLLRFEPENGLHVIARGRLSVYEPKGEYQIVCEHLEPKGLGALQLAVEQLKKRLQAEGLFDEGRKRPLPALPRKIGIVTSLDGAALRDILQILRRRHPTAHIVIRPSRVQGEGAAEEIARALRAIAGVAGVDVVIVGRGGGAIEDLWAFNDEGVARAIAAMPMPVISAVGHEIDTTVADLVADLGAPTPSAGAELVVARKDEFTGRIDRLLERATAAAAGRAHRLRARVHQLEARPGWSGLRAGVALRARDLGELTARLRSLALAGLGATTRRWQDWQTRLEARDPRRRLGDVRTRLAIASEGLRRSVRERHRHADARLGMLAGRLESLSPLAVLGRGYAVCWNDERTAVVRDAATVPVGARVRVRVQHGELGCTVDSHTDALNSEP
jgi:exodeoxyribonuclease VII large subunit